MEGLAQTIKSVKEHCYAYQAAKCILIISIRKRQTRRVAVYCNIDSKRAFPAGVLDRWHNCLLIYWRTSCLVPEFDNLVSRGCHWVMSALSAVLLNPGEKHWIDSLITVKMKTGHPVEELFGGEFPAICNHCGFMTAWSRKSWKFCGQFLLFLKTTPYGKIFKIVFPKFTWRYRSTLLYSNVKFVWRESVKSCVIRVTKKQNFGCLSSYRYCAYRVQNMPGPARNI